jgi:hypothetical protein
MIYLFVDGNEFFGTVPSFDALVNLNGVKIGHNAFAGDVPDVPSPDLLYDGYSELCPNAFTPSDNPAWDAATGVTPWYSACDSVFTDGFDG